MPAGREGRCTKPAKTPKPSRERLAGAATSEMGACGGAETLDGTVFFLVGRGRKCLDHCRYAACRVGTHVPAASGRCERQKHADSEVRDLSQGTSR